MATMIEPTTQPEHGASRLAAFRHGALMHRAGAAVRWAGRLAAPAPSANLPRVEMLPAAARAELALPLPKACRACDDATLAEAFGQGGHW